MRWCSTPSCDVPHLTRGERVRVGAIVQMVEHHISAARIKDVAALVAGTVMNAARTALRVKPRVSDEQIITALRLYLEDNTPITITLQQLLHRTPQGRALREQYASCTACARARCPLPLITFAWLTGVPMFVPPAVRADM